MDLLFYSSTGFGGLRSGGYGPPGGESSRSGIRTMLTKDGKYESVINDYGPKPPTITVISHEEPPYDSVPRISSRSGVPPPLPPHGHPFAPHHAYQYTQRGLPRQGSSSLESGSGGVTAPVHVHTVECSQRGHIPQHPPHGTGGRAGSPPEPSYCDFHCCALHEEGRKIQVNYFLMYISLLLFTSFSENNKHKYLDFISYGQSSAHANLTMHFFMIFFPLFIHTKYLYLCGLSSHSFTHGQRVERQV